MGIWIIKALGISLMLTLIMELVFAFAVRIRESKDLILVVLVNVLTNPFVVFVHYVTLIYTAWNQTLLTGILEAGAVLVEAFCYRQFGRKSTHPFLLSLGANVFSYFTGEAINYFL